MNLLDQIKRDKGYSPFNSQKWFINKIKELTGKEKVGSMNMLSMNQKNLSTRVLPGMMYSFIYSPKHRDTLPLYDKFPLILPFNKYPDGFIGLNLHYLRPLHRINLLQKLMEVAEYDKFGVPKNLNLSWSYLNNMSKFPEIEGSVKRYLSGYVRSHFIQVPTSDWALAALLPTENFAKKKPW